MSTKGGRRFSGEFKARAALGALRGGKTAQEIAAEHGAHPVQVGQWKRRAQDGLPGALEQPRRRDEQAAEKKRAWLERKIGQLTMEMEFLKKPPLVQGGRSVESGEKGVRFEYPASVSSAGRAALPAVPSSGSPAKGLGLGVDAGIGSLAYGRPERRQPAACGFGFASVGAPG